MKLSNWSCHALRSLFLLGVAVSVPPYQELGKSSAQSPYRCLLQELSVSIAVEHPPGQIEQNKVMFTEAGTCAADFYFRNLEPAAIEGLAVVMDYTDKKGLIIDRVPAIGVTERAEKEFRPPFPIERVYPDWKQPLLPGEVARVQAIKNGIRTGICPTQAAVKFIMVRFSNGAVETFSSPGWQLGPIPKYVPAHFSLPSKLIIPPLALRAKVKLSASGQVVDVVSVSGERLQILALIRDQMRQQWPFNPAVYEGRAVESELSVLFRFHADRTPDFPEEHDLLAPVTLIEFFPEVDSPGTWEVAYGRLFSGSGVESPSCDRYPQGRHLH